MVCLHNQSAAREAVEATPLVEVLRSAAQELLTLGQQLEAKLAAEQGQAMSRSKTHPH